MESTLPIGSGKDATLRSPSASASIRAVVSVRRSSNPSDIPFAFAASTSTLFPSKISAALLQSASATAHKVSFFFVCPKSPKDTLASFALCPMISNASILISPFHIGSVFRILYSLASNNPMLPMLSFSNSFWGLSQFRPAPESIHYPRLHEDFP